jgi:hypothetical protein
VEKSRFVREKSKIPVSVSWEGGISRWSGLLDVALALGFVSKPSAGWYVRTNPETGESEEKKFREADTNTEEFWRPILEETEFKEKVKQAFSITSDNVIEIDVEDES